MSKRKRQKRNLDKGLWLVLDDDYIPVKKSLLKPEDIAPTKAIRYGHEIQVYKEDAEGNVLHDDAGKPIIDHCEIELVETAHRAVHREDLLPHIENFMDESGATPDKIFKADLDAYVKEDADALARYEAGLEMVAMKRRTLIQAILALASDWPLQTYKRGKVNRKLQWIEEYETYQVASVTEFGKEILEPFPYLHMTHQFPISDENIWPRIYWDHWLPEKLYEIHGTDDATRFKLWKLMNLLDNWPFYKKDDAGKIVYDEANEPVIDHHEEVMAILDGYNATSGTTKQYHAILSTKRITSKDGDDKFVLVMMLSRTVKKFAKAMLEPQPGEVPVLVSTEQKPVIIESVAQMLKAVT